MYQSIEASIIVNEGYAEFIVLLVFQVETPDGAYRGEIFDKVVASCNRAKPECRRLRIIE